MNLRLATEKEKFKILGPPGDESFLVKINIPLPFKLAWMKDYTVRRISCHKVIAPALLKVYQEIAKLDTNIIEKSGITLFGGCYNFRATRGSENSATPRWSAHAWAVAVDHDPARNGLYWKASQANIPKYPEIIRIFNKYGFLNFGQAKNFSGALYNRDWMHFEASYELLTSPELFINP